MDSRVACNHGYERVASLSLLPRTMSLPCPLKILQPRRSRRTFSLWRHTVVDPIHTLFAAGAAGRLTCDSDGSLSRDRGNVGTFDLFGVVRVVWGIKERSLDPA